ncbi:hypothetical protein KUCAC02_008242 [Chaenocephalus aceratus]|uniref:Uncharacterized protein n=1 Tax=Chaenocephalus aceratus TaxID=36190 RepID=A0ACB9X7Y9_CHAAC|nr:hypothetical protein KUCAC02_008242 [Chaenocephalus aceratus]
MPKLRRGRGGARGDLWKLAGGEDRVLQSFIAIGVLPNPISSSSEVWSRLASVVFGQDSSNNRKWLYTTWPLNRKGIQTRVEATLQRQSEQATGQKLSASQEQHVEQDHQVNKKDDKETQTGTVSDQVKEESEVELLNDDDRIDDIAKQGTESEDDSVDEHMYTNDERETETDTNSESEDDADTEQVENDERKTYIGTESEEVEDNYSEVVQGEIKSEKITQTGTDSEEEDDSEIESVSRKTDDPGLREFVTFVFARIQNTVSLQSGQDIFKHLCTVLLAEHVHPNVHQSLDFLQQLIAKGNNPTLENGDIDSESQSGWEEEEQKRAHTIVEPKKKDKVRKEEPAISEKDDKSGVKCPATPNKLPVTVDQGKECTLTKTLWEQGQTELVVSVIKSQDQCVTLRHSECMTLRPEELICGEVNLDTFDAAVSFVNVNNNHWRFVPLLSDVAKPLRQTGVGQPQVESRNNSTHSSAGHNKLRGICDADGYRGNPVFPGDSFIQYEELAKGYVSSPGRDGRGATVHIRPSVTHVEGGSMTCA